MEKTTHISDWEKWLKFAQYKYGRLEGNLGHANADAGGIKEQMETNESHQRFYQTSINELRSIPETSWSIQELQHANLVLLSNLMSVNQSAAI